MRVRLTAVGRGMPRWVAAGFEDYARRLPPTCRLELREVPAARGDPVSMRRQEGQALLAAVPERAHRVALELDGKPWSTGDLARQLERWLASGRDVALLVGGAEGLDPDVLEQCDARWSLSRLTFPHQLVRVIVAEQIYRAWSLLQGHPYHRA
jgi:23S rRNA (pseudouridine1915-N3)-methyltransferase